MIKNSPVLLVSALVVAACKPAGDGHDELQGVIELHQRVLGFELPGRLLSRSVERGQVVQPGQELGRLDDGLWIPTRDARAADLAAARAQLKLLEEGARSQDLRALANDVEAARALETTLGVTAARTRALRASNTIPQQQLDDAEGQLARAKAQRAASEERLASLKAGARPAELRASQARVDAAQAALDLENARLSRAKLVAPVAGVILDTHAEPGEVLGASAPVVTLGEVQRPYIDLFVPEGDLAGIQVGAKARVHTDANGAVQFEGQVEDVGRRTEFAPRYLFSPKERPNLVVRVRVELRDPNGLLRAGVPAFGSIDHAGAAPSSESGTRAQVQGSAR
jgi:HlyD family secretion protein